MTSPRGTSRPGLRGCVLPVLVLAALFPGGPVQGQEDDESIGIAVEGEDYRVYDRAGSESSLAEIVWAAGGGDVLLVGEEHGDMPGHAFEAELLEAVFESTTDSDGVPWRPVVLSLEMFERDVQYVVDEYLEGLISETHFLRSSRPWDFYEQRYRALVEAAKERGAPVVAANAPRRYVSRVTEHGPASLESLSDLAKSYLPPLPYPGPSEPYRAQWDELMAAAMGGSGDQAGAPEPSEAEPAEASPHRPAEEAPPPQTPNHAVSSNAIYSQALWDASMGHAITNALVTSLGGLVVHFAGSFHVARGTGIPERIEDYRPGTRVTTVVITKVDDIETWSEEEHAGLADYVVLTRKPEEPADAGGT